MEHLESLLRDVEAIRCLERLAGFGHQISINISDKGNFVIFDQDHALSLRHYGPNLSQTILEFSEMANLFRAGRDS